MSDRYYKCYIENLSKKIKEAKETNNLERERILNGFSRLLSICSYIYKIIDDYEDCEEFEELIRFFSFLAQIFCNYIEHYINDKKISLDRLEIILDCLVYEYTFYGGGNDERGNSFLSLEKIVMEDKDDYNEFLHIPLPITKTDQWYNDLKSLNRYARKII